MSENMTIDYAYVTERIAGELLACRNSDPIYANIDLKIENERQFTVEKEMLPNTVYVVLHFGDASVNFGQVILPIDFKVISERNKIELTQSLFSLFVSTYNMKRNGTMAQFYTSPTIEEAFVEVKNGWRASLSFAGAFLIGSSESDYVLELDYEGEAIDFLTFAESYKNDLRPQPTPDGGGFAKSVSGFATHAFTITTYLTTSAFCKKLNAQRYSDDTENTTYKFTLKLRSGTAFTNREYKCLSVDVRQKIGESTLLMIAFSL